MAPTMYDRYMEDMQRKKQRRRQTLGLVTMRSTVVVLTHPIDLGKTLIQLGHEPIVPYSTHTLLGKEAVGLPGIFSYLAHIKAKDGVLGMWRGLQPKLVLVGVHALSCQAGLNLYDWVTGGESCPGAVSGNLTMGASLEDEVDDEIDGGSHGPRLKKAAHAMVLDCTSKAVGVLVSQPFHVITVRCMAQFVGRETQYCGMISSVRAVLHENGWAGFFSGLVPRLLGEVSAVVLTHVMIQACKIGFPDISQKMGKGFDVTGTVVSLVATSITYPFVVVATCMTVSGSGLAAGGPPNMPLFGSWTDAWSELSRFNQLDRGSSILKRYYKGSPNLGSALTISMAPSISIPPPSLDQFRDPKTKLF